MSFNGTTLGFDISPLREGINEANTLIKTNESKWKEYASVMTDWNKNAEGLQARNDMLNEQLAEQEKKVSNQEEIVADYIKTFGEQAEVTQKQIQILNSYKTAVNKTTSEIERNEGKINDLSEAEARAGKTTAELKADIEAEIATRKQHQKAVTDTEKRIDDLSKAEGDHSAEIADLRKQLAQERKALDEAGGAVEELADDTAEAVKETEGFSGALKGLASGAKVAVAGLTAVAGAVAGAVGGMASLANETRESRGLWARMETNAESAGKSYQDLTEDLKGVYAITGDLEAGFEGMNMLSNLKADAEGITAVTEALAGASMKFDGLKFEGIAEALQESVAGTAGAVGGFAELIERSGGDLETFNAGMANCKDETERTQYAMGWLANSGLADVSNSFKENNKALVEARNAEIDLQLATNELGAVAEPVSNSIKTMGASFVNALIPGLEGTVTAFKDTINGVAGADKDLQYNLGYLIGSATRVVKGWWETAKPALNVMFTEVFPQLAGAMIAKIPGWIANIATAIYDNAPKLISSLFDGIVEGLSGLQDEVSNPVLKTLLDWLISAFQWVSDNSQLVTDGLLLIAGAFAGFKIISTITGLVDAFKTSFGLLNAVMSANPIGLVITAIAGLVAGLTLLYKNSETFREFVNGLWENVKEFGTNLKDFATKTIPEFVSDCITFLKELPGKMKAKFDEGITEAVEWGANLKTKAGEAITGFIDGFLEKAKNIKDSVSDVGKRMIEGVWEGINNAKEWLSNKIGSIFGADGFIINGIKKLLGIHSPAEELKPIGDYFMQGFEAGLEGRATATQKVAEKVIGSVVKVVENSAGEVAKAVEGVAGATATAPAGVVNSVANGIANIFGRYKSELDKVNDDIAQVTADMAEMARARDEAYRMGKPTAEFDNYYSNAYLKLEELKKKAQELANGEDGLTFGEQLTQGFNGFDGELQNVLAGAFTSAINGDTSALTGALQSTGDFLVNGLQNVLKTAIPGVGGFVASAVGGIFNGIKALIANKKQKQEERKELQKQIDYAEKLAQAQAETYNTTLRKAKRSIAQELASDSATNIRAIAQPATATPTNVVNYTQNNYSPKALSAKEIYRNNNRAINMIQQGVRA